MAITKNLVDAMGGTIDVESELAKTIPIIAMRANALDVSADALLIDVVTHSVTGVTNELSDMIGKLPKNEQKRILMRLGDLVDY